jgi:hypothetical protein
VRILSVNWRTQQRVLALDPWSIVMRRPLLRMFVAVGAAFLVGGCGGSGAPSVPGVPVESPEPPPAGSAAPEQSQAAAPRADPGEGARVTVLRYRQPFRAAIPGRPARSNREYAAVEIEVCVARGDGGQGMEVSWSPWSLSTLDGVVTKAVRSWGDDWWDAPLYPNGHVVRTSRCARGWVPFELRKGTQPDLISYAPSEAYVLEWAIAERLGSSHDRRATREVIR